MDKLRVALACHESPILEAILSGGDALKARSHALLEPVDDHRVVSDAVDVVLTDFDWTHDFVECFEVAINVVTGRAHEWRNASVDLLKRLEAWRRGFESVGLGERLCFVADLLSFEV